MKTLLLRNESPNHKTRSHGGLQAHVTEFEGKECIRQNDGNSKEVSGGLALEGISTQSV